MSHWFQLLRRKIILFSDNPRITIHLHVDQDKIVRKLAEGLGVTISEMIRIMIDFYKHELYQELLLN